MKPRMHVLKLALQAPLFLMLVLVACNRQTAPAPPAVSDSLAERLPRAREALQNVSSYRWTTTFSIKTGSAPEAATVLVEGARSREPDGTQVEIRKPGSESQQTGWVQIGDDFWLYRNGEWIPLPASAATDAVDHLAFLDPVGLWDALDDSTVVDGERVGEERVGEYNTQHYRLSRRGSAFLPAEQITPTRRVSQDLWLDAASGLPVKTRLQIEGTNPQGVSGQMTLETVLSDIGAPLAIAPPAGAAPRANAGSDRVIESLPDGSTLPLASGAEPTLPEALPDNVKELVQSFSLVGNEPSLALQIYSTPASVDDLASFFVSTLTSEGYALDQRVTEAYTGNATVLLFSTNERNAQIILIPLDAQTLVITTLQ